MESITLTTSDNIRIAGNFYKAEKDDAAAIILLHMMPSTKESWSEFAPLLVEKGFQVLAIDERGHGESTQGGILNYENFTKKQQQEKILDVVAAQKFFLEKGVPLDKIIVGGASIGANLSVQYLAENKDAKAGFALSPGFNYKGVKTRELITKTSEDKAIFMAAAKDDPSVPTSWNTIEELSTLGDCKKKIKIFDRGGHGTNIFKENPEFMNELADWLLQFK